MDKAAAVIDSTKKTASNGDRFLESSRADCPGQSVRYQDLTCLRRPA
jgi:hypothetical protein